VIKINLLPVRQTKKLEAVRREVIIAALLGVFVVAACMALWGAVQLRLAAAESANAKLQKEIDVLGEDAARVDVMEKYKLDHERKLAVIGDLRAQKTGPVHMMDEIAIAAPEKLQLMRIEERRGAVKMEGAAVSNEVISQFLSALESSDYFAQVYLVDIEANARQAKAAPKVGSTTFKNFKLTAQLVRPQTEAEIAAAAAAAAREAEIKAAEGKAGKAAEGKAGKAAPGTAK
jgi:type IV pilus assembly protein PilN